MKKILLVTLILFIFSGCTYLEGMKSINTTEQQALIEKKLIENSQLEDQNITITSSIITTIENLEQLQMELDKLEQDIENISYDLNKVANNDNLNQETIEYLKQLNELTQKSSIFINQLSKSTKTWEAYLVKQNTSNLNFTQDSKEIINSIEKPLEAFE